MINEQLLIINGGWWMLIKQLILRDYNIGGG
jgi:hypothetical protein